MSIPLYNCTVYGIIYIFILCCTIDHDALLQAVAKVEEPNIPLIPENFNRPFSLRTPPIKSENEVVICPADDGTIGFKFLGSKIIFK